MSGGLNLAAVVLSNGRSRPEQAAIIGAEGVVTYREALHRLEQLAGFLAQHAGNGDLVGLALGDTPDHVLLHYAVAWIGATIVPIDHRWSATEKQSVAAAFGCRLVLHEAEDDAFAQNPRALAMPSDLPPVHSVPLVEVPAAPIVLSLSSGTTGRPTGALVSHAQLYERFVSQWAGMRFNSADRFLLATPLYFGGGRSFAMSFLAAGGTVILAPPPLAPLALIDAVRRHRATVAFLVPTQIRRLLEAWQGEGLALPDLRLLVTSGAATHPQERQRICLRLCAGLMDYYASSEGGGIAVLPPEEQSLFPETVGRPAFRVEVEIVDKLGRVQPSGVVGRLRYRGPGVSSHLIDATGALVRAGEEGWFEPGDLACILPSGHVQLRGRAKDVIIRGGVNIYPEEIEAALSRHPAVLEVAVFGAADPMLGETVAAALVLRPGQDASDAELQAHVRETLAPYKAPHRFARLSALPRNPTGKVIRSALQPLLEPVNNHPDPSPGADNAG